MIGSWLDLLLLVAVLLFAVTGYRQGFIVGAFSFAGFLGGGVLGLLLAPRLAGSLAGGPERAVVAVAVVFVAASLGQLLAGSMGTAARRRVTARSARTVDSLGGAAVSGASVLLVAWLVATAVVNAPFPELAREVRRSRVLAAVDQVMPDQARTWFSSFRRFVQQNGFPPVFGELGPPRVAPVGPPDADVLADPAIRAARRQVVRVSGVAGACFRGVEGTGFVYGPHRVMTNAHVVAGVRTPVVSVAGSSERLPARVVRYDARRDVAVLYVPGLDRPPLRFAGPAAPGSSAVVAGFPENGPFTAVAARVRGRQQARGPDIYQRTQVTREVYALRARVRPGNSGGPLLAPDGSVYGVVFAAAADDPETGYALTAAEVAPEAAAGRRATQRVSSEGCD
ncbi:MAG TPA: MarP family serine protease [Mycobacteriales bacterium]|nr:MarP family serine protease [Mycobacteriales bacterium]